MCSLARTSGKATYRARSRARSFGGRKCSRYLAWTVDGYTVKFGQGAVILVRTAIDDGVFEDEARLKTLLDGVRRDFRVFDP